MLKVNLKCLTFNHICCPSCHPQFKKLTSALDVFNSCKTKSFMGYKYRKKKRNDE